MAARKNHQPIDPIAAAKARQVEDRVRRARMATPPRGAPYYERCAELARAVGLEPCDVMDDWDERAAIRQYDGNVSRDEAERLAFLDVLERYERQRRLA